MNKYSDTDRRTQFVCQELATDRDGKDQPPQIWSVSQELYGTAGQVLWQDGAWWKMMLYVVAAENGVFHVSHVQIETSTMLHPPSWRTVFASKLTIDYTAAPGLPELLKVAREARRAICEVD